jgi:MFS transporter, ACS family, pantothenate transporter
MAIKRMEECGRKAPSKLTWRTMREVFTMWPVYLFSIAFAAQLLGIRIYNYFTIYLKDAGYSVEATNLIPTGAFGFQATLGLAYALLSAAIGHRIPCIYIGVTPAMIGTIILCIYPEHNPTAMMVGWYLTYAQTGCVALIMAYLNVNGFGAE